MSFRSYLYVAAHDEHRITKAYCSDAECIVLDLEDAVPDAAKDTARRTAAAVLAAEPAKPTQVRLSHEWRKDLAVLRDSAPAAVRVPKCEGREAVRAIGDLLDVTGSGIVIVALLESARGIESAMEIATAHHRVMGLALGEADLRADLNATSSDALLYARLKIISVARAAGLPAPVQSVYTDVFDLDGLARSCQWGRSVGFFGRSAVHPAQITVINDAYTPTDEEVTRARRIIEAFESALTAGSAAALLDDGSFIDPAIVRYARSTIRLARKDTA